MTQIGADLIDELATGARKKADFKSRTDEAVDAVLKEFRTAKSRQLNEAFASDTLDTVRYMPKPDLAAFAESLVTLSSMKRKASLGPETWVDPLMLPSYHALRASYG